MKDEETNKFQDEWFELAAKVCQRIYANPEVQLMREHYLKNGTLSWEERSSFITICNRIKYEVIHELFGEKGTEAYEEFKARWRHWYDTKGLPGSSLEQRRLTNVEHIVFSSTPDPVEFMENFGEGAYLPPDSV